MPSFVGTAGILEITLHFSSRTKLCVAQKAVTSQNDADTGWIPTHSTRKDAGGSNPRIVSLSSLLASGTGILELISQLTQLDKDIALKQLGAWSCGCTITWVLCAGKELRGFPFPEHYPRVGISFGSAKPPWRWQWGRVTPGSHTLNPAQVQQLLYPLQRVRSTSWQQAPATLHFSPVPGNTRHTYCGIGFKWGLGLKTTLDQALT